MCCSFECSDEMYLCEARYAGLLTPELMVLAITFGSALLTRIVEHDGAGRSETGIASDTYIQLLSCSYSGPLSAVYAAACSTVGERSA